MVRESERNVGIEREREREREIHSGEQGVVEGERERERECVCEGERERERERERTPFILCHGATQRKRRDFPSLHNLSLSPSILLSIPFSLV